MFAAFITMPSCKASLKRSRSAEEDSTPSWNSSKRVKTSLLGDDNVESYDDIHPHFVMCGRGERANRHPGNKAFRRVVEANRPQYHSGPRRNKILIAESIVQAVYHQVPPGRFVRFDKESELWIDVGTKAAIKKTSQALREDSQKDKSASEESSKKDDDNESSNSDEEDEDQDERKLPARPSPPGRSNARDSNLHAHQHGFGVIPGTVSFHSSEQGESEAAGLGDDFDRMIDGLDLLAAHDADFEPLHLDEPLADLSRTSSAGSSNAPMPISLLYQSSIDSGAISVVSRSSDSDEASLVSKSIFDHGHGMTRVAAV